jgi:uncharacterized membrane protein
VSDISHQENPPEVVAPTREDPLLRAVARGIGGVAGRRIRTGSGFWTVQRVLLAMLCVAFFVALLQKAPCQATAWVRGESSWFCYSDVPVMFRERGLAQGNVPYFDTGQYPALEYPVLIGFVMWITAAIARTAGELNAGAVRFFDLTALLMIASAVVTVIMLVRLLGRRPWDAAMFALAPVLILSGLINWDLLAVALTTGALLAWARRRPVLAGVLIGLGMATKLYPLFLLGPIFILCLRTRRTYELAQVSIATLVSWAVVNAPVYLWARDGWKEFWRFNDQRDGDFGSVFYVLELAGHPLSAGVVNVVIFALFAAACLGVTWLGLNAARRPRLAQLVFLVVAAFLLVNKVYSPQYALWLLPLAVLARPRWRDVLIWQAAEAGYWIAIWMHLTGSLSGGTAGRFYYLAVFLHIAGTLWLVAMVVRDILQPEHDPVRQTGDDDPGFAWAEDDDAVPPRRAADRGSLEPPPWFDREPA